jgi:hypothetical protein
MEIRLQSLKPKPRNGTVPMSIHTPGLIAWAKAGYGAADKKNDLSLVTTIAESFGLKREVVLAILTGEIESRIEGDDVVIEWPGDDPLEVAP